MRKWLWVSPVLGGCPGSQHRPNLVNKWCSMQSCCLWCRHPGGVIHPLLTAWDHSIGCPGSTWQTQGKLWAPGFRLGPALAVVTMVLGVGAVSSRGTRLVVSAFVPASPPGWSGPALLQAWGGTLPPAHHQPQLGLPEQSRAALPRGEAVWGCFCLDFEDGKVLVLDRKCVHMVSCTGKITVWGKVN